MRAILDYVIIKVEDVIAETAAGVIIPEALQDRPQRGVVQSAGKGTSEWIMSCVPGDMVVYGPNAGVEFQREEEKYLLMREEEIIAIV